MVAIQLNSHPAMANKPTTKLDLMRTVLWARMLSEATGIREGKRLERFVCEIFEIPRQEAGGMFRDYLNGKSRAFTTWEPVPNSQWIDKTAMILPIAGEWFYSPFWYLLEDVEYLPSQVMQCVLVLPPNLRGLLLIDAEETAPTSLHLAGLYKELIYEIADPVSPWAIGGMACALRRAELAGEVPLFRLCTVGIVWLLDQAIASLDPWVREPLEELRAILVLRFSAIVYPMMGSTLRMTISESSLSHFGRGVDAARLRNER